MLKMNRTILLIVIALLSVAFSVHAEEGDKRKGKYTYRNIYKACHEKDPAAPGSPPVNPDSKTQAQWEKVFEAKDFNQFGCPDEWAKLSEDELKNICAYLVSGAADSPTPAKCK